MAWNDLVVNDVTEVDATLWNSVIDQIETLAPATHFGYIEIPAGSMSVPDTNPANYATNILANGFAEISVGFTTDDQSANARFKIPRDWTGGTGAGVVTAMIDFSTTDSSTNKGAIFEIWGIRIADGSNNATATLVLLATTVLKLNAGAECTNTTAEVNLGAMTGTGKTIMLMLKRGVTQEAGDTIPAEVKVLNMELKYIRTLA